MQVISDALQIKVSVFRYHYVDKLHGCCCLAGT